MDHRRTWIAAVGAATLSLLLFAISDGLAQGIKPGAARGTAGHMEPDSSQMRTQVDSLERANAKLSSQVTRLESQVNRLLGQEGQATRQAASDWNQFRLDVLKVMDPKLKELRNDIDRIASFETAYSKHRHEYIPPRGGWANFETLEGCPDCLINFTSSADSHPSEKPKTSEPK
jgi:hypothetical protein